MNPLLFPNAILPWWWVLSSQLINYHLGQVAGDSVCLHIPSPGGGSEMQQHPNCSATRFPISLVGREV